MIKFSFNNPNSRTVTSIAIYRTPIGTILPDEPDIPPIAILDGFATEFTDNDTELGTDYNYRIAVFKQGGEIVLSPNMVFGDVSLYGPGNYYEATDGSNDIWDLGEVSQGEELPSITDLTNIAGPNTSILNWSGKWRKFRIGAYIYFTPVRGVFKIANQDFEGFMSMAAVANNWEVSYCSYVMISSLESDAVLSVLDGRYPTQWSIRKEFPRQNALEPYAGTNPNAGLVYGVRTASAGTMLVQRPTLYSPCSTTSFNMVDHASRDWYWKPIFRFVPKTDRNNP